MDHLKHSHLQFWVDQETLRGHISCNVSFPNGFHFFKSLLKYNNSDASDKFDVSVLYVRWEQSAAQFSSQLMWVTDAAG